MSLRRAIHKIETGKEPKFPCWLFLPECSEWQWYEGPLPAEYMKTVMSHWSPGWPGRPESPIADGGLPRCSECVAASSTQKTITLRFDEFPPDVIIGSRWTAVQVESAMQAELTPFQNHIQSTWIVANTVANAAHALEAELHAKTGDTADFPYRITTDNTADAERLVRILQALRQALEPLRARPEILFVLEAARQRLTQ